MQSLRPDGRFHLCQTSPVREQVHPEIQARTSKKHLPAPRAGAECSTPTGARWAMIVALVSVLFASIAASSSHAQITAAAYDGPGDFAYDVQSMPDLDQKRSGLAFDGSMYCVPTACMNLCAFAANHGFPGLAPGPGTWIGTPGHDGMSLHIWLMGSEDYMNTDPDPTSENGGTNGTGKIFGLTKWIIENAQPLCIVSAYPDDDGYWPTVDQAALHGANGAIVQMSYGRYVWDLINGLPYLSDRQGGHAVTIKLAYADNGNALGERTIHYRDPATDEGDLDSNSDFASVWPMSAANIAIRTGLQGIPQEYTVTSIENPPTTDSRYQIFDSYLALYPGGGLSYSNDEIISEFIGGSLGFANNFSPVPFDVGQVQAQQIIATVPHPLMYSSLVLVYVSDPQRGDFTQLYELPHNGRFTHLMDLPAQTRCLALGSGHSIFAATDAQLMEMVVVNGTARIESTQTIPPARTAQTSAMTYDPQRDQIIVAKGRVVYFIPARGPGKTRGFSIQGLQAGSEPIRTLAMDDQTLIAATERDGVVAASTVAMLQRTIIFRPLSLPGVNNPLSADLDSYGRLYVCDEQNGLQEFMSSGRGRWMRANNPYFDSARFVGRRFVAFKNRTNIDLDDLDPSQWYNVDPDELAVVGPEIPDAP